MDLMYQISVAIAFALGITLFIFGLVFLADKLSEKLPKIGTKFELSYQSTFLLTLIVLSLTMVFAQLELSKYQEPANVLDSEVTYTEELAVE